MILLENGHRILTESLTNKLSSLTPDPLFLVLADFDGVTYKLVYAEGQMTLSMSMKCFSQAKTFGAMEVLKREYGNLLKPDPETGYDVTLTWDPSVVIATSELISNLSILKKNALSAPFEVAFDAHKDGNVTPIMKLSYRDDESMYIQGLPDRVTVIFSTVFKDESDSILGKVFLQEFVDARRLPNIQNAPQVLYSPKEPPLELKSIGVEEGENLSWVTFVLFPRHYSSNTRGETISRILLFRDYLHYHMKASKSYLHSRMRARVDSFLKVLNRAKPEPVGEKKTSRYFYLILIFSGKTFKR